MKKYNKIVSLMLTMFLLVAMGVQSVAAKENNVAYSEEINVIKAFGIMNGDENGDFNQENNLTRAEFAQVISTLLKLDESDTAKEKAWYFRFGEDNKNDVLISPEQMEAGLVQNTTTPVEKVERFIDVNEEHWAYDVINKITDIGYMVGVSSTKFAPDEYVTVNQVNKVLVKMLGYEAFAIKNGGYPAGYNYTASSIKLLKGVNHYGETPILRGELAKMIYNMLEINLVDIAAVTDNGVTTYQQSDKTFLEEKLGINKRKATITATDITAVYNQDTADIGEVVAGGVTYKVADGVEYINNFLNRTVEFYTVQPETGKYEIIIYACLADDEESIVIDIKDFIGFTDNGIKYYEDDEEEILDTSALPVIMVNSVVCDLVSDSTVKAFTNGTITVSKSENSKAYDLVSIEGYNTLYVKNIAEYRISNGLAKPGVDANFMLNLDPVENKDVVITYYKDGVLADINQINTGSVLDISKSDKTIKVVISDKKITTKLTGISNEADGTYLYDSDGAAYKVAKEFVDSEIAELPEIGGNTLLYLNSFGEVSYATTDNAEYENIGLYIDSYNDARGLKDEYKLKVLTNNSSMDILPLADKVTFTDSTDSTVRLKKSEVANALEGSEETILSYLLNDNNEIVAIKEALNFVNGINRPSGRRGVYYTDGEVEYKSTAGYVNKAYTTSETKIFIIADTDVEDELKYTVSSTSPTFVKSVTAYNTEKDSPVADYVVVTTEDITTQKHGIRTLDMFIVTKVLNTTNADGDQTVKVEGTYLSGASDVAPTTRTYESSTGAFGKMLAFVNPEQDVTYSVKKGDIINVFEVNSNVEYASLVYRPDAIYPTNTRAESGALVGFKNSLIGEKGDGNPMALANNTENSIKVDKFTIIPLKNSTIDNAKNVMAGYNRIMDMFAVRTIDKYVTVTNQDLSDPVSIYNPTNEAYITYSFVTPKNITVITYKNGNCTARAGSVLDIKTYENSYNKCSRILVQTYEGKADKMIVINYEN